MQKLIRRKLIGICITSIAMLWCSAVLAQTCPSYPVILLNGTTADANQVMADFNAIRNCVNSNVANGPVNTNITSITGLTTPLAPSEGGTQLFVGGTSTGAANAQVVATTTPNSFTKTQGYVASFIAGFTNTLATTLNVNSTGVSTVSKMAGGSLSPLAAGDLVAGTEYYATWDGSVFELLNPSSTTAPVGSVTMTGDDTGPSNANVVQKVDGVSYPAAPATNTVPVITALNTATYENLPNCPNGLAFNTGTHAFSCAAGGTGTLTAGTTNTMDPFAIGASHSQAHGLGATPAIVQGWLECKNVELGYSVGDRVSLAGIVDIGSNTGDRGVQVEYDATNTLLMTVTIESVQILNKGTLVLGPITPANWKLIAVPYRLN